MRIQFSPLQICQSAFVLNSSSFLAEDIATVFTSTVPIYNSTTLVSQVYTCKWYLNGHLDMFTWHLHFNATCAQHRMSYDTLHIIFECHTYVFLCEYVCGGVIVAQVVLLKTILYQTMSVQRDIVTQQSYFLLLLYLLANILKPHNTLNVSDLFALTIYVSHLCNSNMFETSY